MANVYFGDVVGQTDQNWNTSIQFTVSGVTVAPTAGAIYSNNGIQFKVTSTSIAAGSGTINAGGTGTSLAAGVLTKVSGTGDATIAFSAKADVNWFLTPGFLSGCCCCTQNPGTPAGRLPTAADTVIIVRTISVGPDISPWTGAVTVTQFSTGGGSTTIGDLSAGTFSGAMTNAAGILSGTVACTGAVVSNGGGIQGGTFSGAVSGSTIGISGGTFTSSVTLSTVGGGVELNISGGTFNGTIVNSQGSSTAMGGRFIVSGSPTFNCAIPSTFDTYNLSGGTYDRTLVMGVPSPTLGTAPVNGGSRCLITFNTGFSTSRDITIYQNGRVWNTYQGRYFYGTTTINAGIFTGNIVINKLPESTISVLGGSYTPPAVTTPAIKSGNNMTFLSSAIPTDWGFRAQGLTFNPTILLSGTSNDILGSGLP